MLQTEGSMAGGTPCVAAAMQRREDGPGYALPEPYAALLEREGMGVVPVEPTVGMDEFAALLDRCCGFLIPGGNDIEPKRFGEAPQGAWNSPVPERDEFELAAVDMVLRRGMPFLGICRGIQVLNVVCGGGLIQDLPDASAVHNPPEGMTALVHEVAFEPDSLLSGFAGTSSCWVNSAHHQAVGCLGHGIQVEARSPDGVVEAVRVEGQLFAIGVQWHPEALPNEPLSRALACAFAEACRAFASNSKL